MWALRRLSNPLRNRGLSIRASAAAFPGPELRINGEIVEYSKLGYRRKHDCSNLLIVKRGLSSKVGSKDGLEGDDLEDGYGDEDGGEISHNEVDSVGKRPPRKRVAASLVNAMVATQGVSVRIALDRWFGEGNELDHSDVYLALSSLRKIRMYGRALQFFEWLQANKRLEFSEMEYSSHLDLIAKVQGLVKAENFMEKIPESFRTEFVYRTFLANCVLVNNVTKAEAVFNKMRDLKFPHTTFACNQLLLLYKRTDKKKVGDVLLLMEKEKLIPSLFTYKILVDLKGSIKDIQGIEAILEKMKVEDIKPDLQLKSRVVRHYISAGHRDKAEALLREIEGKDVHDNRLTCRVLLEHYSELGEDDEVARIWKACKESARGGEFIEAVKAWGKLKNIEKAEAVFEEMMKVVKTPTSLHYNSLLEVYTANKMLEKGKALIKRMSDSEIKVGPLVLDSLLKLFIDAGLADKADEMLLKASRQNHPKPLLFRSYMIIMDWYAEKGDVRNAEKIFRRMRDAGYTARFNQFQTLMRAYIKAKQPAYGMRERMKADNLFPNKDLVAQLVKTDSFMNSPVSDLLD